MARKRLQTVCFSKPDPCDDQLVARNIDADVLPIVGVRRLPGGAELVGLGFVSQIGLQPWWSMRRQLSIQEYLAHHLRKPTRIRLRVGKRVQSPSVAPLGQAIPPTPAPVPPKRSPAHYQRAVLIA